MSSGLAITLYLAAALLAGILGTTIASVKRRGTSFWMVACFLLPPLLIVLLLLPKRRVTTRRHSPADDSLDSDNLDEL